MTQRIIFVGTVIALLAASYAHAATRNWDGDTSAAWATAGNWDTAPANDLTTDIANFNLATYGGNPVYAPNAGTISINGITIGSVNGAMTLTTANLSIGGSGISIANGAGTLTVSGTLTAGASQSWLNNSANLFSSSGSVGLGGSTLTVGGSGDTTLSGVVSGTGGRLTKDGAGILTLSGKNTFSSIVTVSAGTLRIVSGGAIHNSLNNNLSGALTVNGGVVEFDSWTYGTDTPFGQVWDPAGNIVVNGGTLRYVGAGNNSGARSLTIGASGAILESSTAGQTWTIAVADISSFASASGGLLTLTGIGNGQIYQIIPGSGGVTKSGNGTWTLSGANTYTGATTVNAGQLSLTGTINGSAITVSGGSFAESATGVIKGAQAFTLNSSGGATLGGTNTYSGNTTVTSGLLAITGSSGRVYNSGTAGTFTISSGATLQITGGAQAYAGLNNNKANAFVVNGTLICDNLNWDGSFGTMWYDKGNIVINGGTLKYTGTTANGYNDRAFTIGTSGATLESATAGELWTISASSYTLASTSGTLTLTGVGDGRIDKIIPGTGGVTKNGTGTWTLGGANTYAGTTTVSQGTLAYGVNNALSSGAVTVSGGTLDIKSYTDTVGAVTLSNGGVINGTSGILTGTSYAMQDGNVSATLAGSVALTKTTAGTVTLTATNTYTGATTINDGTLLVNGSIAAGSTITFNAGTLGGSGTIGGSVTVPAAGNLAPGSNGAGTLSIGGALTISALAGGKLYFQLDATADTSDKIAVTGGLTLGSGTLGFSDFDFTNLGGMKGGTYTLITSGGISGTLQSNDLSGSISGQSARLQIDGNSLELVIIPSGTLIIIE